MCNFPPVTTTASLHTRTCNMIFIAAFHLNSKHRCLTRLAHDDLAPVSFRNCTLRSHPFFSYSVSLSQTRFNFEWIWEHLSSTENFLPEKRKMLLLTGKHVQPNLRHHGLGKMRLNRMLAKVPLTGAIFISCLCKSRVPMMVSHWVGRQRARNATQRAEHNQETVRCWVVSDPIGNWHQRTGAS